MALGIGGAGSKLAYQLDPDSGFPIISIKMGDDTEARCPFVTPDGCSVYHDRPTACRLYPLGRAAGRSGTQEEWEGFFFVMDTPGCLGTKEKKIWTVEEWLGNQGLLPYIKMNDSMLNIVFHQNLPPLKLQRCPMLMNKDKLVQL